MDEEERLRLLSEPRREAVRLSVGGGEVILRDQGPLFGRKDLGATLGGGPDVSDWIHLLNQRTYFFTDETSMQKFLDKYVEVDGAQDVIWLSPLKLLDAAGLRLELASQNTGVLARRSGTQKTSEAFAPLWRFTDRKPAEATIVDGLDDLSPVFRAELMLSRWSPPVADVGPATLETVTRVHLTGSWGNSHPGSAPASRGSRERPSASTRSGRIRSSAPNSMKVHVSGCPALTSPTSALPTSWTWSVTPSNGLLVERLSAMRTPETVTGPLWSRDVTKGARTAPSSLSATVRRPPRTSARAAPATPACAHASARTAPLPNRARRWRGVRCRRLTPVLRQRAHNPDRIPSQSGH